jgi:hypothetical protein
VLDPIGSYVFDILRIFHIDNHIFYALILFSFQSGLFLFFSSVLLLFRINTHWIQMMKTDILGLILITGLKNSVFQHYDVSRVFCFLMGWGLNSGLQHLQSRHSTAWATPPVLAVGL